MCSFVLRTKLSKMVYAKEITKRIMKKTTILIIAVGLFCAACSSYTCPTYSNKIEKAPIISSNS